MKWNFQSKFTYEIYFPNHLGSPKKHTFEKSKQTTIKQNNAEAYTRLREQN